MTWHLYHNTPTFQQQFYTFLNAKRDLDANIDATVDDIIYQVKADGDAALLRYTNMLDHCNFKAMNEAVIEPNDIKQAYNMLDDKVKKALNHIIERVSDYHQRLKPKNMHYYDAHGNMMGARYNAVERAGLYVPGGKAAYPSSVIMNAVPAIVAGVPHINIVTPTPYNVRNSLVLATAHALNIQHITTIGGAQAVAALAYGTETITKVDVITGPGNAYVASAKKQLYGTVGIDMIAGPSEILIIASHDNNPHHVAMDLLSQAEHDEQAQSILITDSVDLAHKVEDEINNILQTLPRANIAMASWQEHGCIIIVDDLVQDAPYLSNIIAPEHLEIMCDNPEDIAKHITQAGALFLGRYTPEAIGDYIAGPNHVLPTNRSARFASSLSVENFMTRSSIISCTEQGFNIIKDDAITIAALEGLDAHALSMSIR